MTGTAVPAADPAAVPAFPYRRATGCPFDPPPQYAELREEAPVSPIRLWNSAVAWLLTRYEDQRAVLADPRFSADVTRPGHPVQSAGVHARRDPAHLPFLVQDDPEHHHTRRMFTAHFTVKRVATMKPRIQEVIDHLLDAMEAAGPPADLVSAFALPMPSLVIGELLGVPHGDHSLFQRAARTLVTLDSTPEQARAAAGELAGYLDDLITVKDSDPADDLLSTLVVERVRTGELDRAQLVENAVLLLAAGHETTANMTALGTLALLHHPEQLAAVRDSDDPARVANAVEELLRYLTITHSGRRRVATEDVEIAGTLVRAGEGVVLANDAGNRDGTVFPDPDRLDIDRTGVRRHIAFGHGTHQCLGQNLARAELQLAYPALLRRFPGLRTTVPDSEIRFKEDMLVYGVHELPVAW
ncbi:cytochrome P450 [Streptomyces sp. JV176]|uniref:cytochrome P450 n=1 Tax=Streptomyces sp. JV176 TaxID=858630 RepID=UPI002E769A3F|nr:cytochrome P450 [Streptomyces sp. JV176]MEE1801706.1 cytochrome P450 [Streptomyces sp. JV176]